MFRSLYALRHVQLGFDPCNVVAAGLSLPDNSHLSLPGVYDPVVMALKETPGVTSVALSNLLPVDPGSNSRMQVLLVGGNAGAGPLTPGLRIVSRDYYKALDIAVLRGHTFSSADTQFSAVVNRAFVRQYLPQTNPLGQYLAFPPLGFPGETATIVGVVEDTRQMRLSTAAEPEINLSYEQFPAASPLLRMLLPAGVHVVAKMAGSGDSGARAVRRVLAERAGELLLSPLAPLPEMIEDTLSDQVLAKNVLVTASGAALIVACVGMYGLISQYIASRKQELGLRLTFGASYSKLAAQLLEFLLWRVGIGCALGVVTGLVATTFLKSLLFGLVDVDVLTAASMGLVVFVAALLSAAFPLKRLSSGVGPITELLRS